MDQDVENRVGLTISDAQKPSSPHANSEELEGVRPKLLPNIDEFPQRIQPILTEALNNANDEASQIDISLGLIDDAMGVNVQKRQELQLTIHQSENAIMHEEVTSRLNQVVAEIQLLATIRRQIEASQDAPELRDTQSPFDTRTLPYPFRPEEIALYKAVNSITERIKRTVGIHNDDVDRKRHNFRQNLEYAFDKRLALLLARATNLPTKPFLNTKALQTFSWGDEPLTEVTLPIYEAALDTYINSAKKIITIYTTHLAYLDGLDKWAKTHAPELTDLKDFSSKDHFLESLQQALASSPASLDFTQFQTSHWGLPQRTLSDIVTSLAGKINKVLRRIPKMSTPITSLEGPVRVSCSQEFIDLAVKYQGILQNLDDQPQPKKIFDEGLQQLENLIGLGEETRETNEQFSESQDLLYHTANLAIIKDILRKGVLSSKKSQTDRFGEARFNTAGGGVNVKVGKDYVEITDLEGRNTMRITKEEYRKAYLGHEQPKGLTLGTIQKRLDEEWHQVCFSENSPYYYFDGVVFVFSKASLFSKSQFMNMDGWHLFDPSYTHDDPDSPGFAVDLTKEPMMIVASENVKDDLLEFVKTDLAHQPVWRNILQDPSAWIKQNVIFVPYEGADRFKYNNEYNKDVQKLFFSLHPIIIQKGMFVPTGEFGEGYGGTLVSLLTYKVK